MARRPKYTAENFVIEFKALLKKWNKLPQHDLDYALGHISYDHVKDAATFVRAIRHMLEEEIQFELEALPVNLDEAIKKRTYKKRKKKA